MLDFKSLNDILLSYADEIILSLLPGARLNGNEYTIGNLFAAAGDSLSINRVTGKWADFATGDKGSDLISLYAAVKNISQLDAANELKARYSILDEKPKQTNIQNLDQDDEVLGCSPTDKIPTILDDHWVYRSKNSKPCLIVVRTVSDKTGKKTYYPLSWSKTSRKWVSKYPKKNRPLYNLDEITNRPTAQIVICEGEKSADAASKLFKNKLVTTTWSAGCNSIDKTDWSPLFNRQKIIIWPDNDAPGIKAAEKIASILYNKGSSDIKIIKPDKSKPAKWDAADCDMPFDELIKWVRENSFIYEPPNLSPPVAPVVPIPLELKEIDIKYPTKLLGFMHEKGDQKSPDYHGMGLYLKDELHLLNNGSSSYIYENQHYKSVNDMYIKHLISNLVDLNSSPSRVNNFFNKSMMVCYQHNFNDGPPDGLLNCNNGILDTSDFSIKPHTHEMFFRYKLDHDFNPKAECPEFDKAMNLVTNNDKELQDLILEVFGYCIYGGDPIAQKAFMFYGDGGNGKSTILNALRCLLGMHNVSHIPLPLFDKPFSMVSIDGKMANIIDETPKFNINAEAFKNVVTGGVVRVSEKGKPEYDVKVKAKIIFACNTLPNFSDSTAGIKRRLIIIPFNHQIKEDSADRYIDSKIQKEMSGILNKAIQGLQRLRSNSWQFTKAKACSDVFEEFKNETDSVHSFLSSHLEYLDGDNADDVILYSKEAFSLYIKYCEHYRYKAKSFNTFSKGLSSYTIDLARNNEYYIPYKNGKKSFYRRIRISEIN